MIRKGYILSKGTLTRQGKNLVELWVSTDTGPVCLHSDIQNHTCFVASSQRNSLCALATAHELPITCTDDGFHTLNNEAVSTVKTASDKHMIKLRHLAKENAIILYEADIRLADRYLMERFIYGAVEFVAPDKKSPFIGNAKVRPSHYTPSLTSVSIDIECDENQNLYSIAIASHIHNEVLIVKHPTHCENLALQAPSFAITWADTEKTLLTYFIDRINRIDPDIIMGWNVKQFDMAVLARRARMANIKLTIGRNKRELLVREWEGQTITELAGRVIVDGIEALKTMTYHFDSFALDNVAEQLVGERKLIQSDDKLAAIKHLYINDPIALATYNHTDCVLVNRIAEQSKYIDFLILRGTLTGLDIGRPGGSVAAFLNVYLPKLHRRKYISGVRPDNGGLASPGGYVMNSQPGLYDDVIVLDYKSLYPSIIRTFKIDPMGLAEGKKTPENAIPGFKGAMFSKTEHFLPDIIDSLWKQRDQAKRQQDAPRSQAIKILMNSFYGVLGSGGCPFYDPRLASSITLRGHEIMQTTARWIEELGYNVIYGDTDSTFVHIADNHQLGTPAQTGKILSQQINKKWQQKLAQEFGIPCYLEIEFETYFSKFFMPTIRGSEQGSKKRYAGLKVTDTETKLVFKGLENVRSDWTELAKEFQYNLYRRIFESEPVETFIKSVIKDVKQGAVDHKLVYSKRLRKPISHYIKSLPPHVKAAKHAELENQKRGRPTRFHANMSVPYIITTQGPQTPEYANAPLNYEHYIEKQIMPIADSILPLVGLTFSSIITEQMSLFG